MQWFVFSPYTQRALREKIDYKTLAIPSNITPAGKENVCGSPRPAQRSRADFGFSFVGFARV